MQALILAGGMGTRLRPVVADRPKCLAEVAGRPLLEYLVRILQRQGVDEVVLATGYGADAIRNYFEDGRRLNLRLSYSHETEPLGTAGAIRHAGPLLTGPDFLILNGDSVLEIDLHQLSEFHRRTGALITLGLTEVADARRYGTVELDGQGRIRFFREKTGELAPGIINGGVYVATRQFLDFIPSRHPVSLETEVLPQLVSDRSPPFQTPTGIPKQVYGMISYGYFVDIGVPDDYAQLQQKPERLLKIAGLT